MKGQRDQIKNVLAMMICVVCQIGEQLVLTGDLSMILKVIVDLLLGCKLLKLRLHRARCPFKVCDTRISGSKSSHIYPTFLATKYSRY